MFIELILRLFYVSVTQTSRECCFERFQNEGPFHFADEALLLKAEGKWSTLYHVKANQNFAKNKSMRKKFPLTWYINCGLEIQLWEVILISELLGILRVASKGKILILIFILRASDDCLFCF